MDFVKITGDYRCINTRSQEVTGSGDLNTVFTLQGDKASSVCMLDKDETTNNAVIYFMDHLNQELATFWFLATLFSAHH